MQTIKKVVLEYPPNYDAVLKAFPDASKPGVVFTYGSILYNPSKILVPDSLRAHESIHCDRQAKDGGPEGWWSKYLTDKVFRGREETLAHKVEYDYICMVTKDRERRFQALRKIAGRLSSTLYQLDLSFDDAKKLLTTTERQIILPGV